jgi:hypothetical protein
VAVVASCTASCTAASLPFLFFCPARRLIVFVNEHESSESCFRKTRVLLCDACIQKLIEM